MPLLLELFLYVSNKIKATPKRVFFWKVKYKRILLEAITLLLTLYLDQGFEKEFVERKENARET